MIQGKLRNRIGKPYAIWTIRAAALFGKAEIFAILDYEKTAVIILLENLEMMGIWIYAGHSLTKGLGKLLAAGKKDCLKAKSRVQLPVMFALPVAI